MASRFQGTMEIEHVMIFTAETESRIYWFCNMNFDFNSVLILLSLIGLDLFYAA